MSGKRKRRKYIIIPGDGDPCPRCGKPMQIREYDGIDAKQERYPSFYTRWFCCKAGWSGFLKHLKERGLRGVRLIISELGIIERYLPSPAKAPPSGPGWLHEIKHDGFRILARRDSAGVRLITRSGNDFSSRFPLIAMAVGKLPVRSCLIDGEAIVCDENGPADFELIRGHGTSANAVHCAFDLLELDGRDLRRRPIEERKGLLAKLLHDSDSDLSIVLNKHYEEDGAIVFREACRLGCEGIVSKRLGSIYRRG